MTTVPNNIVELEGDITCLDTSIPIIHQCNLTSTRGAGLAYVIHKKFPYSNIYKRRRFNTDDVDDKFGTIVVSPPDSSDRGPTVISLLSQHDPGGMEEMGPDTPFSRLGAFVISLMYLSEWVEKNNVTKIAFPLNIGCGLAGGNWTLYSVCIADFARRVPTCEIQIVRLPQSST